MAAITATSHPIGDSEPEGVPKRQGSYRVAPWKPISHLSMRLRPR